MFLLLKAFILGIVEGITEFLPISSTGHLILVGELLEFSGHFADQFDFIIQLGAILAVVVHFFNRLWPFGIKHGPDERRAILGLWTRTLVGVVPALIIGALWGETIQKHLLAPMPVATALIVGGVVLLAVDRFRKNPRINDVAGVTYGLAFAIGLIQCVGMFPGTSRSAATIVGALLLGCSRTVAAEFSFFLAIPTLGAASAYSLLKLFKSGMAVSGLELAALAVGFVTAFFVAWAVIAVFMNYIRSRSFAPFGWYRIVLGVVVLVWLTRDT